MKLLNLLLTTLVFTALFFLACKDSGKKQAVTMDKKHIYGEVIDSDTEKPIAGVEVVNSDFKAVTDNNGLFNIDFKPGEVELVFKAKGKSLLNTKVSVKEKKAFKLEQVKMYSLTVLDNETKLLWQKGVSDKNMGWDEAEKYCEELSIDGKTDWRLPKRVEYMEILGNCSDKINKENNSDSGFCQKCFVLGRKCKTMFPDYKKSFWTSSPYTGEKEDFKWMTNFKDGYIAFYAKNRKGYARCVSK